jgi:Secretion system C-terminal sorting domain/Vault protein inter-alpha-trypsin domain
MKNVKTFLSAICTALALLLPQFLIAQNSLRVVDPKTTWRSAIPTITEATISIRPRGLYMEYGVYLTYSAQQTSYNTVRDTLEVQHFFQLPQGSAVNDSWLWVDSIIMKALLWDRWSATSVYEGIVKRRQDPSILYKNSTTNYEYRIFPIIGNQTRRVKLNFYVPAKWSPTQLTAPIPLSILINSAKIPNVNLIVYDSNDWNTPKVDLAPNLNWTTENDPTFGTSKRATLTGLNYASVANISYNSVESKPYFFTNSPISGTIDEGYYQLAFSPKAILNDETSVPKKVLLLVDYEATNTAYSPSQILNLIKKNLKDNLSPRDSFNVFYNRLTTKKVNTKWVVADSANIERAFAAMTDPSVGVGNSSILTSILAEGYDFIKTQRGGEIMLISSNDAFASLQSVQSLYNDLESQYRPLPITHVYDFATRNLQPSVWYQSRYYYGNELLYNVLTSNTRGNFVNLVNWNAPISDVEKGATNIFQQLVPYSPIDVTIKPNVGLTYERYSLQDNVLNLVNQPFMQVGKYKGNLPLTVEVTTTNTLNQIITGKLIVQANATMQNDSSNKQIHGANKISVLEATPTSNSLISRIIQESKVHRILSRYTAFIALEPSLQTPCDTCRDETGGVRTSTIDARKDSVKITVYPNPFKDLVSIKIEKPASSKVSNALITNILGQPVKTFAEHEWTANAEKTTLTWQDAGASAGTYIFSINIDGKRYIQKLVKIRE